MSGETVVTNDAAGAVTGVRHLVRDGHRRVDFLDDKPGIYSAGQRKCGFQQAVRILALETDSGLLRQGLHVAVVTEEQVLAMLGDRDPPTVLFAANNLITAGVLRALRRRGAERIGPVGFDDFDLAVVVNPQMTVIVADAEALGRRATERLISRLAGDGGPPQTEVLATLLILRGSGNVRS